jgi:hypothetical protein
MNLTRKNMEDALVQHFASSKNFDEMASFPFTAAGKKFEISAVVGTGATIKFSYWIDDKNYNNKLTIFDYYLDEAQYLG